MNSDRMAKLVRQALATRGMKGTIPLEVARRIRSTLLVDIDRKGIYKNLEVLIELHTMHIVGDKPKCDCSRTKITVRPKSTKSTINK